MTSSRRTLARAAFLVCAAVAAGWGCGGGGGGDDDVVVDRGAVPEAGTFHGVTSLGGRIGIRVGSIEQVLLECGNTPILGVFSPPAPIEDDGSFDVAFTGAGRTFRIEGVFTSRDAGHGRIRDERNQCDATFEVARREAIPLPTVTARPPTPVATASETPVPDPTPTGSASSEPQPTPTGATSPQPTVTVVAGTEVEIRDLGTVSVNGTTQAQTFQVSAQDVTAVQLIADSGQGLVVFDLLGLPSGAVALDPIGAPPSYRQGLPGSTTTLFVPNTPLVPAQSGTYTVSLDAFAPASVRLTALVNHRAPVTAGQLALNLFFVAVPGLSAATAPGDPQVARMLEEFDRIFAQIGLRLGAVTFNDVPEPLATSLTLIDPDRDLNGNGQADQLDTLFALPRATSPSALDLFFVRQFVDGNILGLAGAIAGPSHVAPTTASGVVVTTFDGFGGRHDPEVVALIAVHEAAHYLGLYHSTEAAIPVTGTGDQIPDTPTCGAGVILGSPTQCPDVGNVMFPGMIPGIDQTDLTSDQGFVVLRNPLVVD